MLDLAKRCTSSWTIVLFGMFNDNTESSLAASLELKLALGGIAGM